MGLGTIWVGSTLTGAPFYIVEKTFYDFPVAIIDKARNSHQESEKEMKSELQNEVPEATAAPENSKVVIEKVIMPRQPTRPIMDEKGKVKIPAGLGAEFHTGYTGREKTNPIPPD